ncbi:probable comitin at C-terminar half [Coccomyxa sp. Obi]|nr:probable comitin at C-terminar half [Coccomyxa sp. Obi]
MRVSIIPLPWTVLLGTPEATAAAQQRTAQSPLRHTRSRIQEKIPLYISSGTTSSRDRSCSRIRRESRLCVPATFSTMSYGDYNPDEVSERFQDQVNLDSQGGGGYGGDDYDGEKPKKHHHKKKDDESEGGGDGGYGGGDSGYGGGQDQSNYGGDQVGYGGGDDQGYGSKKAYGGDDSEGYGAQKTYGDDDGEGYGSKKKTYGDDDGEGYGSKKKTYGDDGEEGYGSKKKTYGDGGDEGYGAQKTTYGEDDQGYGSKATGYGDDSAPQDQDQYQGTSGGLSSGAAPTRGEAVPTDVAPELTEMSAGGTMHVGQTLKSPSGQAKLVLQGDGNLVLYKDDQAVWASGTDSAQEKPAMLAVQDDGNVCLYAAGGQFCGWATDTGGSSNVKLIVSDTGVLVVLSGEQALWSSQPIGEEDARQFASAAVSSY